MPDIIDLDALVPEDKKVNFNDRTWTLPGDMPMTTYLRVNAIAYDQEEGASQEKLLGSTVDALIELFCWNVPEAQKEARGDELRKRFEGMGLKTIMRFLGAIYREDDDEVDAEAVAEDPTPPESGTTTTTKKRSSRSAS